MSMRYSHRKTLEIDIKLRKLLAKDPMGMWQKQLENPPTHMSPSKKLSNSLNQDLRQDES
jgi:hypothetical protein